MAAESLPRPEWRVGDRWSFKRTTATGTESVVTHRVVAATTEGYTVRTQGVVPEVTRRWTLDLHLVEETAADGTFMRYDPPALFFSWPFKPGDTWAQEFQYADGRNDGRYANTWKVGTGVEPIDTVAGRFYTLRVERWGGPPAARGVLVQPPDPLLGTGRGLPAGLPGGAGGSPLVVGVVRGRRDRGCGPARHRGAPGWRAPLAGEQPHGLPRGARPRGRPRRAGRPPDARRRGRRGARPHPRADDDGPGRRARPHLGRALARRHPRDRRRAGAAARRGPRAAPADVGRTPARGQDRAGRSALSRASRSGSCRSSRAPRSPTGPR